MAVTLRCSQPDLQFSHTGLAGKLTTGIVLLGQGTAILRNVDRIACSCIWTMAQRSGREMETANRKLGASQIMDGGDIQTFDVFLSHAHIDAALVGELAKRLTDDAAFDVWLDRWILVPGGHWQQEMAKGLNYARTCAVCIGKQTPQGWFREEIEHALNRQAKDQSFRVIPVILPGGDQNIIDNFLALRTWVDFSGGLANEETFHILVSGIKGVPPGRAPQTQDADEHKMRFVREQLARIRALRSEQLIDDMIALEYQRRLLDRMIP
jgi:TIR domain-containing protein